VSTEALPEVNSQAMGTQDSTRRYLEATLQQRDTDITVTSIAQPRSAGDEDKPELSVIIPTRDEAGNVPELMRRLDSGLGETYAELLFVDDSDDDTPMIILREARLTGRPVRVLHRQPGDRTGGLGSAVVMGFRAARAPWAVVMDGDLQHPPEIVPRLIAAGRGGGPVGKDYADFVVATRYSGVGDATGLDGATRATVSAACTALARRTFPRRLASVSDPMSGFFAVRLEALDLDLLRPAGYKILLEVLVRSRPAVVREVSFSFQPRLSGDSKASIRQGLQFARQLASLRLVGWQRTMRHRWPHRGQTNGAIDSARAVTFVDPLMSQSARHLRGLPLARVARALIPIVLCVVAFPNLLHLVIESGRLGAGTSVDSLLCLVGAAICAFGRLCDDSLEPDVHDRQLDIILALPLVATAAWLTYWWPGEAGLHDGLSDHEVVAATAFLAAGSLLIAGTRATVRLRLPLLLMLLAMPSASTHKAIPAGVMVVGLVVGIAAVLRRHASQPAAAHPSAWYRPPLRLAAISLILMAAGLGVPAAMVTGGHETPIVGAHLAGYSTRQGVATRPSPALRASNPTSYVGRTPASTPVRSPLLGLAIRPPLLRPLRRSTAARSHG
jgi:hypothetical protein